MKPALTKFAKKPPAPVFQTALHKPALDPLAAAPVLKLHKRDNTFSKSRDTREDRGTRQMKVSHNAQTFPHGHQ